MRKTQPKKKIKTLWLASWYPHAAHPLLGNFTRRDAEAVAPFAEVIVVFAIEAAVKKRSLERHDTEAGFVEIFVFIPKSRWKFMRLLRFFGAYQMGWKYLATEGFRPDLIHLHVILPAGIGALYLHWKLGVPLVISEHWSGFLLPKQDISCISWFHRQMVQKCSQIASTILTVTTEMALGMKRMGGQGNFITNPNVVDVENLPFRRERVPGSPFRFVHVSSLDDDHKNVSGILMAIQKLATIRQDFILEIIGGDNGTSQFETLASKLGLKNFVCFKGRLPHSEVMKRLAASDAFVLFSNREGLPCVLLEAMAVGLPVISTDLPGLADWITPENGFRIPKGDVERLQSVLLKMMDRKNEFDEKKIREFISARCSYNVVGKNLYGIYIEVLASDKKSS